MACDLSTIQAAACESGIGKLDSKIKLLQAIAQLSCELSEADPGNVDGLIWGPSPETVAQFEGMGSNYIALINGSTGGAYTTLSFGNPTHVVGDMVWTGSTVETSLTFRLLETVGGQINFNGGGASALTSVIFESLVSVGTDVDLGDHPALVNLGLDQLVSVGGFLYVDNNAAQTTLSLPALTSVDSIQINNSAPILSAPVLPTYPPSGITADATLLTLNLPACVDDGAGQLNTDLGAMVGLVTLTMTSLTSVTADLGIGGIAPIASVDFSSLATIGGNFGCNSNPAITALSLPSLVSTGANFDANSSVNLASISLPAFTTCTTGMDCSSSTSLSSFSAPLWVPTDGTTINFNGDSLDIPSVELILRRCVLAGVVACTIDLSGGTNAGTASLSAQGQADVATLGAQVTMNP